MLAVVAPWAPDVEVLDTLARAGAAWAVPLRVPGVWLVERTPVAARAPAPRVVLIPIAEGWSASLGCTAPLPPGRRR